MKTGHRAWRTTFSATEPSKSRLIPVLPWLPIATRSIVLDARSSDKHRAARVSNYFLGH